MLSTRHQCQHGCSCNQPKEPSANALPAQLVPPQLVHHNTHPPPPPPPPLPPPHAYTCGRERAQTDGKERGSERSGGSEAARRVCVCVFWYVPWWQQDASSMQQPPTLPLCQPPTLPLCLCIHPIPLCPAVSQRKSVPASGRRGERGGGGKRQRGGVRERTYKDLPLIPRALLCCSLCLLACHTHTHTHTHMRQQHAPHAHRR
jgi:hypothetical protein